MLKAEFFVTRNSVLFWMLVVPKSLVLIASALGVPRDAVPHAARREAATVHTSLCVSVARSWGPSDAPQERLFEEEKGHVGTELPGVSTTRNRRLASCPCPIGVSPLS